MALQRIAGSLRRHDWVGVGIELVIVVAGILIALQLDTWNEHRKQRAEAAEWRQQILADLYDNRFNLEARINYYGQALAFAEAALPGLLSDAPVDDATAWSIVLGAFQAGQIWPYQLTGPSYREVQNAGGLALIDDPGLLGALAYLYDVSAHDFELITGGLPRYRELIRERMPWPIQEHIWDSDCQVTRDASPRYVFELVDCPAPSDSAQIQRTVADLRQDQELLRALHGRMSQLKVSNASTGRLIEQVGNMIGLMEGRVPPP